MGKGFFGPGTVLRELANTLRWPQDASGDRARHRHDHRRRVLGSAAHGAGSRSPRMLSHFAKYGTPDDPDDGVAMNEFFVETLVADDDDANLGNGTPHADRDRHRVQRCMGSAPCSA